MNHLEEVVEYYNKEVNTRRAEIQQKHQEIEECHRIICEKFMKNIETFQDGILYDQYNRTIGYGEYAFSWNWYLLVQNMPSNFKFLEIGVYCGRILALIKLISQLQEKNAYIYGVTPLSDAGDEYSKYASIDYLQIIKHNFAKSNVSMDTVQIIQGFSQHENIIKQARDDGNFDIIFIDGCHDYEIVCSDISNYSNMLNIGGYLVMDDASSLLEDAYGEYKGHMGVGKAIRDILDNDSRFVHLFAVAHTRVWKRII